MRNCEACGRDFAASRGQGLSCPWCGFNTAHTTTPRSQASLKELERKQEEDELDQELYDYLDIESN